MSRKKTALMCLAAAGVAAIIVGLMLRTSARRPAPTVDVAPAALVDHAPLLDTAGSVAAAGAAGAVNSRADVVVGKNDTMDAIFTRLALDKTDLAVMRRMPDVRHHFDSLRPGDAVTVEYGDAGSIRRLSRKVSETRTLEVVREDPGFAVHWIEQPVDVRVRCATAVIDASLFQAAEAAGISDNVALKLANVFAWDIDFVLDIRTGDRFTAVYEQIYQNGKYLRDGEVLAAEFVNDGRRYRAIRFTADGGAAGYYTPDGKPMRKAFLRAPVEFTRVSSVFAANRLHPILNLIRGHMGTDYAAPTGTPVHAAGDGRVSFAGVRGGYGNAIVLLHSSNVSTLYGHMSRFAKNVRVGSHVAQGEVIGYVGMTGLATGPHLHYEFLINGVHMNPQTVRLPGAEPLHADALARFHERAGPLLETLTAPPPDAAADARGAPGEPAVATAGPFADGGTSRSQTSVD